MDDILDYDIAHLDYDIANTAELLKLDRLLLLKFKYETVPLNIPSCYIPKARVQLVYDWYHNKHNNLPQTPFYYQLSKSSLTIHGWQQAPAIVKISNKSQLQKLNIQTEMEPIFDLNWLQSLLIIPLYTQKPHNQYKPLILGLLIMQNKKSRRWQMADMETGKWMAKQITSTFIHQHTVIKVQSLVDERTAQLQVSLDVQAKLGQKLRDYVKELKRVNKIKDEFIASLSDALKTPLSNMKMGIKMLRLLNKDEKAVRYLNILGDECEKEINLVNNLLTLQELQSNKLTIEPQKIYLKPLLDEFYNFFSQQLHYQNKNLIIENKEKYIFTDLNSLNLIIKELITNAIKFSSPKTDIFLKFFSQKSDIIIQISNYGCSIPSAEQEQIFQPFYQGNQVENVTNSGTGLGLALVESLVHNLHGIINVSSEPIEKSEDYLNTFTITFPSLMNDSH